MCLARLAKSFLVSLWLLPSWTVAGCLSAPKSKAQVSRDAVACNTIPYPYEEELLATANNIPAGWINLKNARYAKYVPCGSNDWSLALQAAIDDLATSGIVDASCANTCFPVHPRCGVSPPTPACASACAQPPAVGTPDDFRNTLFIPAGTYAITRSIKVRTPWIRVIGEDPQTTKIVWTGPVYDPTKDDSLPIASSTPGDQTYAEAETGMGRIDCLSEPQPIPVPKPPGASPNNCSDVAKDANGYPLGRSWMFWVDGATGNPVTTFGRWLAPFLGALLWPVFISIMGKVHER